MFGTCVLCIYWLLSTLLVNVSYVLVNYNQHNCYMCPLFWLSKINTENRVVVWLSMRHTKQINYNHLQVILRSLIMDRYPHCKASCKKTPKYPEQELLCRNQPVYRCQCHTIIRLHFLWPPTTVQYHNSTQFFVAI